MQVGFEERLAGGLYAPPFGLDCDKSQLDGEVPVGERNILSSAQREGPWPWVPGSARGFGIRVSDAGAVVTAPACCGELS